MSIAALVAGAQPAIAQVAQDQTASDDGIIVSARRREERLQEVPVAVAVLS